jgi:hypothetical protein
MPYEHRGLKALSQNIKWQSHSESAVSSIFCYPAIAVRIPETLLEIDLRGKLQFAGLGEF